MKEAYVKWIKCGYMPLQGWKFKRPIRLKTYRRNGDWFAGSRWLQEYGIGSSRSDAIVDFMKSLMSWREWMETKEDREFGPAMIQLKKRIDSYVVKR